MQVITDEQLDSVIETVVNALDSAGADVSFLGTFYSVDAQEELKKEILKVLN